MRDTTSARAADRERIAQETRQFLAGGGRIKKFGYLSGYGNGQPEPAKNHNARRHKIKLQRAKKAQSLLNSGKNTNEVAEIMGLHETTVANYATWLKREGL